MATAGRSALLSSTPAGPKSTLDSQNPEEDDGQDLWWGDVFSGLSLLLARRVCQGGILPRKLWVPIVTGGGGGEDGLTASSRANEAN